VIYHLLLHINDINLQVKNINFFSVNNYVCIVNTTDAGNGVLSVKIKQNENKISHEQTRISNHIYEISFIPETSNECIAQLSFNEENNCKSCLKNLN